MRRISIPTSQKFQWKSSSGAPVDLSFVRHDVQAGERVPGLDPVVLQLCRNAVRHTWRPLWNRDELVDLDVDREWRWYCQVFHPRMTYPGSGGYVRGSLLLVISARGGGRLEAVARVAHGYETSFLPKVARGRGQLPRRPQASYLDTLATAPWNRANLPGELEQLNGIGRFLLMATAQLSLAEGTAGRIAIEPSPNAQAFYQNHLPALRSGVVDDRLVMEIGEEGLAVLKEGWPERWTMAGNLIARNRWQSQS